MSASYFRTLIAYNRWAWGKVLDRVAELSGEQYASRQFNFGSVRSTLIHVSGTENIYFHRLRGQQLPPRRTEEELPSFELLRKSWEEQFEEQKAFIASLMDDQLGQDFSYVGTNGREQTARRDLFLAQAFNHSTQHRAETAVALTEFGHSPGDLDVAFYVREHGPQ
jgi:uncharacterized damage-inducible protein DinB